MPNHTAPQFHYHSGTLHAEQVELDRIAREVGTPCYIYSQARILENLDSVRGAFPMAESHYSIKANGNLSILRLLNEHGTGFDAVSGGEIYRAMQSGAPAGQIVFAGVGKTEPEIREALELGIGWFNVESSSELDVIAACADSLDVQARVCLRLNPNVQADTHHHISTGHAGAKFGIPQHDAPDLIDRFQGHPALHIAGIHLHIGSQLASTDGTVQAIKSVLPLFDEFPALNVLNIGGGFPVSYTGESLPTLSDFATAILPALQPYLDRSHNPVHLMIEPGRSIIADAGLLLVESQYVKPTDAGSVVVTNGGMTELIRPALYEAVHEIIPVRESHAERVLTHVVGPICESADVLRTSIELPLVERGDLLAVSHVGAYGSVMGSRYNARPFAAEVLINGDRWRVIRRRESREDMLRHERTSHGEQ